MKKMTKFANEDEDEIVEPNNAINELICENRLLIDEANELLEGAGIDISESYI
jgi:hypothetical protein